MMEGGVRDRYGGRYDGGRYKRDKFKGVVKRKRHR